MEKAITSLRAFLRKTLWLWVRGVFFILSKIPFLIVLLVVGYFAFVINDQGKDLMITFGELKTTHPYILSFLALLLIWSGVVWYVARITLSSANLGRVVERRARLKEAFRDPSCATNCELKDDYLVVTVDGRYQRTIQLLAKVMPRILAALPYIIFIWGCWSVNGYKEASGKIWAAGLLGIAHITYLCFRTDIFGRRKRPLVDSDARFALQEQESAKTVVRSQGLLHTTRFLIPIVFIASFVYAFITARSVPSLDGKPGLIILCGLIFYTILGLFIIYISNRLRFPFFTFLLIIALLVSLPRNNNHALHAIKDREQYGQINERLADSAYFKQWLDYKLVNNQLFQKDSIIPIFIVAAEGGGIRACYWTAQVLQRLHIKCPEIYNNTFAATGASGGTIGLGFFYNYIFEKARNDLSQIGKPEFYASLDSIAASDYLSGVTYGFLFPDLAQRVLPWPIASFDRAKFLSNGFSNAFAKHTVNDQERSTLLDQSMLAPWLAKAKPFERPVILFNSLYVEEGQKAVFSPFKLSDYYYEDALDILGATQTLVPMKEAMLSSARFPIITPPGLMMETTDSSVRGYGHLVDGGYFENTAVQTAQQTAMMIKDVIRRSPHLSGRKIVPVIISTVYGSDTSAHRDPMGSGYEAAPLQGAINTLFRWIDGAKAMTVKLDPDLNTINFKLIKYKGDVIPLGWYLSPVAKKKIEGYSAEGRPEFFRPYERLKKYLP